jgi:hypothetical protein
MLLPNQVMTAFYGRHPFYIKGKWPDCPVNEQADAETIRLALSRDGMIGLQSLDVTGDGNAIATIATEADLA